MKKNKIKIFFLLLALLVSSSLANRDVTHHKTSQFKSKSFAQSVVLIEDFFEPEELIVDENVKMNVYVKNGQVSDDIDKFNYTDGYVRIQFREFISKIKEDILYSKYRYLIDKDGNFLTGDNKEKALEKAKKTWPNVSSDDLEKVDDTWYVRTNEKSTNGIYGKFITEVKEPTEMIMLKDGAETLISIADFKQKEDNVDHNAYSNEFEDSDWFTTVKWSDYLNNNSIYRDYIKLILGDHVVSLEEWKKNSPSLSNKWILDTDSPEGWAYWSESLIHFSKAQSEADYLTKNLLNGIKLNKYDDAQIVYRLHVNMDTVDKDDLDKWEEIPTEILEYYKGDKLRLENLIKEVSLSDVKINNATRLERYVPQTYSKLNELTSQAKDIINNPKNNTQIDVDRMTENIKKANVAFKLNLNYEGELKVGTTVKDFAGHNWTIIKIDENKNALMVTNPLTNEELAKYSKNTFVPQSGKIMYNDSGKFGNGYNDSNLKKLNDNFYDMQIKGTQFESFVEPIKLVDEVPFTGQTHITANYGRTDGVSLVDYKNGKKMTFTLSISDWNVYSSKKTMRELYNSSKVWTRTPNVFNDKWEVGSMLTIIDSKYD